nr:NUDIX domain-containing protein [Paenibacillus caui]
MIYDKTSGKVLVQDRIKSWKGISFPGGHIEDGESIVDSTIREIKG